MWFVVFVRWIVYGVYVICLRLLGVVCFVYVVYFVCMCMTGLFVAVCDVCCVWFQVRVVVLVFGFM